MLLRLGAQAVNPPKQGSSTSKELIPTSNVNSARHKSVGGETWNSVKT
jgi:hypothetical protein